MEMPIDGLQLEDLVEWLIAPAMAKSFAQAMLCASRAPLHRSKCCILQGGKPDTPPLLN